MRCRFVLEQACFKSGLPATAERQRVGTELRLWRYCPDDVRMISRKSKAYPPHQACGRMPPAG